MAGVTYKDESKNVEKAVQKANFANFGHAGASIRKSAAASLIRVANKRKASSPGSPPHTHKGVFLKRSIRFAKLPNNKGVIVGPMASMVGDAGAVHEFGERRETASYPARPFMGPALDENLSRMPRFWRGTVGG